MADSPRRYEVFLREEASPHAARNQRELVDRLESLPLDVSVTEWPKRVRRWSDAEVLARYEEFVGWADDRGVRLDPFFSTRGVNTWEDGREFDALVLPVCCLAVYEGDTLVDLYPHADGDQTRSVEDCLDRLEGESVDDSDSSGVGAVN